MRKLREAQTIINGINEKYNNAIKAVKWNDIYNSTDEIIEELKQIHIPNIKNEWLGINPLYKGYEYIHSFAKQVQSGKTLSEKQLAQCKRLAKEIKKAYEIRNCY